MNTKRGFRLIALLIAALMMVACAAGNTNSTSDTTAEGNASSGGPGELPSGGMPGGAPGGGSSSFEYSAATEITSADTQEDQTYASTTADESALIISTTDAVTITNPTVTKTGDSDGGDNCNFTV